MKECARFAPRLTAREGELTAEERAELEKHLAGCEECRAIQKDLRAVEGLVGFGVLRAAARRDFSGFADQVMARVSEQEGAAWQPLPSPPHAVGRETPAGATDLAHLIPSRGQRGRESPPGATDLAHLTPSPAQRGRVREGAIRRIAHWFRAHRALAVGTALAPVAAAAALVIYLSESGPSGPPVGEVDVVTEGRSATVLRTSDGPVVLIGDDEAT